MEEDGRHRRQKQKEHADSAADYELSDDYSEGGDEGIKQKAPTKQEDKKEQSEQKKSDKPDKSEKKSGKGKKKKSNLWIVRIFILTFCLCAVFSVITETVLSGKNLLLSFILLFALLFVNIVFDIIGVAAASADIEPFISKASRKQPYAPRAVKLLKNAEKVSNFCNDVVGDICGIISGGCASTIVLILATSYETDTFVLSIIFSAVISSLTVGGKAIGKKIAMSKSHDIIASTARVLSVFDKK